MSTDSFVHLHVHSEYSLLDGACRVDDLCRRAAEDGAPGVALTDHGVMFGAMEFYYAARDVSLAPIVGCEAYIAPRGRFDRTVRDEAHVTLLAADLVGYRNLVALISKGFLEGYYYKPRIDLDLLAKHNDGLIVLSGCMSSLCAQPLLKNDYAGSLKAAKTFQEIFGDRFYIEIMRHGMPEEDAINTGLVKVARELNLPIVATNDSHYLSRTDAPSHDVLLCIGTGKTVADTARMKFFSDEFYVKSPREMRELFADLPEACDNTVAIAKRIDMRLPEKTFYLPTYPVPAPREDAAPVTPEEYLREVCETGLLVRYGPDRVAKDPVLRERLEYELGVINKMGFASYFLIVWDFIKFARDNDIPVGPGRGSAVGSLVSYCLRITDLDPLKFNLIFERFLNPDRISMPDIDTDFCVERRDEVIAYVTEKYGKDRVAQIVTFGTMAARAAVRDAGRALGIPLADVDRVAKLIPSGPAGLSIDEALKQIPELKKLADLSPPIAKLLATASSIEGLARHASTHAAGVVISSGPLVDYAPLIKLGENDVNTQYSMGWIERIGLLKMDFLGLRNLTVMKNAVDEIRRTVEPSFDLEKIPDDDPRTYEMLGRGETTGVFQLESDGMRRVVADLKPTVLPDIIALVALYRPGPMDWIPQYIANKHGRSKAKYLHPKLESILSETYGIACLGVGTPVWYADGMTKPIEDVRPGDQVLTFDNGSVRPALVERIWPSGKKKALRITLSTGTVLVCSEDHRFPTPQGDVQARDLCVNRGYAARENFAYTQTNSILFEAWTPAGASAAERAIGPDRVELLRGLWDSDGTYAGSVQCFRSISRTLIDQVCGLLSTLKIAYYRRQSAVFIQDRSRFTALIEGPRLPSKRVVTRIRSNAVPVPAGALRAAVGAGLDKTDSIARKCFRRMSQAAMIKPNPASAYLRRIPSFWTAYRKTYEEAYLGFTRPVFIEKIEPAGDVECYDLQMADQASPYFLAGGVATHNCYQEQVMQIARDIAGFSMSDADELRKVMSKKQKDKVPIYRAKFVDGAVANGIDAQLAEEIFQFVEPFAGYGFNKSHAAAYGWISYQTAFLKANFPLQYFSALMTSVKDKTDKLVEYIDEAKKLGIAVLAPDVNESLIDFAVVEGEIRFGLAAIKGVGEGAVQAILAARSSGGKFTDLFDFTKRVESKQVNRRVVEALVKCGALDAFHGNRAQLLAALDMALELAAREERERLLGQTSLFGMTETIDPGIAPALPAVPAPSTLEVLGWEKETLGIFVSGHPLADVAEALAAAGALPIKELKSIDDDTAVTVAGMVTAVRRALTRAQAQMLIATIEDIGGSTEVIVFPKQYEELQKFFEPDAILIVRGRVRSREKRVKGNEGEATERSIQASDVSIFDRRGVRQDPPGWHVVVTHREQIDALGRLLDESPGTVPIVLVAGGQRKRLPRGIAPSRYVSTELSQIFGAENVRTAAP